MVSGAHGVRGEDVPYPASREGSGLVTVQNLREASIEGILLLIINGLKCNEIRIYFPIESFPQNGGKECDDFGRVESQERSCSTGSCKGKEPLTNKSKPIEQSYYKK